MIKISGIIKILEILPQKLSLDLSAIQSDTFCQVVTQPKDDNFPLEIQPETDMNKDNETLTEETLRYTAKNHHKQGTCIIYVSSQ